MKDRFVKELGNQFAILSQLGRGAFSKVYECINIHTHKLVAVKIMRKYKLTAKQLCFAEQESHILQKLNHPNIIKLYGVYSTESFLVIEMECLKEKSLAELIKKKSLTEEESSIIMQTIFKAVYYMHKSHIIHRDLKPENLIFASKDLSSLKIADFGLSTEFELGEKLDTQVGTIIYMSPEQINCKKYSETADIWSCGMIMYYLLTNTHPIYVSGDNLDRFKVKLNGARWDFTNNVSDMARDLFLRCVKSNPIERYSAALALNHPWINHCSNRIPMTHLEEVRLHQDKLKIKMLCITGIFLTNIAIKSNIVQKISLNTPNELPPEKAPPTRTRNNLTSLHIPRRKPKSNSNTLKISSDNSSLLVCDLPKGNSITKSMGNLRFTGNNFYKGIHLCPINKKKSPKSAGRLNFV
ncbi:hypothetical protein SteCoe_5019 [Stentor coeruleus]|uniref:Protein kinase domain-containing protein n=1 Tax=Stentor coeruleus TaxID=5963 RepID=A0A1R2CT98_9CILI|nr:hypothetical protein SteCoe_5019 [Stentor coeruleus]